MSDIPDFETIEACNKIVEGDKIDAHRARLHLFRAQRPEGARERIKLRHFYRMYSEKL